MAAKQRKIEIFSAGCAVCENVIEQIKAQACASCDIQVLDMKSTDVARRANELGINSIPAVAIDGKVADCCTNRGVNLDVLAGAGLGQPLV